MSSERNAPIATTAGGEQAAPGRAPATTDCSSACTSAVACALGVAGGGTKLTPLARIADDRCRLAHRCGSTDVRTERTACLIVCALSSDPITAMPSAAPTWRTVVLVPLATPAFSGSTSERITLVSCELAKPTPMPKSTEPGSSASSVVSVEIINATTHEADRLEHQTDPDHRVVADASA